MPTSLLPTRLSVLLWFSTLCYVASGCQEVGAEDLERIAVGAETGEEMPNEAVEHVRTSIRPRVDWRTSSVRQVPMRLTSGDGSGLRLVSVTGSVVLEDPLALTELHLTFENPEARRREGRFEFDLPQGAALSRLAMKVGGRWMEGEVVERTQGRRTFETYLHWRPKVDPALLEKGAANRVSARVFPILPNERKEIIVSYSQPLGASAAGVDEEERYRLPLQGLPELELLDLRVMVGDELQTQRGTGLEAHRVLEVHKRDFAPSEDLVLSLDGAGAAAATRAGELLALRVRPEARQVNDPVSQLTLLFDTSASSARAHDREVARLGDFLSTLGDEPVRLLAFDQGVELVHDGPASAALGPALATLRERRAFGASNFEALLRAPALAPAVGGRVLLWSDGVATAGEVDPGSLAVLARTLGLGRLDAYTSSGSADRRLLVELVQAGTRVGFVLGPDLSGETLADALTRPGFDGVDVAIEGAAWSYPRSLSGFAPGDDVVVFARFDGGVPDRVRVGFDDGRLRDQIVSPKEGTHALLARAAGRARIHELNLEMGLASPEQLRELRKRVLELALEHRLLTRYTALLVLESEAEYRRYGIGRASRSNILTAGPGGVEILARNLPAPVASSSLDAEALRARESGILRVLESEPGAFLAQPQGAEFPVGNDDEDVWGASSGPVVGESFGLGGLGLVGTGRGGGGKGDGSIGLGNIGLIGKGGGRGTGSGYARGAGQGFGGRGKRVPRVRQAKARVDGALDSDIVRRVVRAHINEVRACYNQGLTRDPELEGRVEVAFTIGSTGNVVTSTLGDSTLGDRRVGDCIARSSKRWRFPKPRGGGLVQVRYPFALSPGSVGAGASPSRPRRARSLTGRRPGDPGNPDGARWNGSAQGGRYGDIQSMLARGDADLARGEAWKWASSQPDDLLALLALGEMLELQNRQPMAARVYGSIIDLHPHRAEMRRTAAERLDALGEVGRDLAIDSLRKSIAQRPDQINGHRLLAWTLVKEGSYEDAYETLTTAIGSPVPWGRFRGVKSLLREDRRIVAAAWLATGPGPAVDARLRAAGVRPATNASLRVVASWETDATDVDLLVEPIGGGDGKRHADVRTGFGPEAWISLGRKPPRSVNARVRYFSRGAMGYATGTVSALSHDGRGGLSFQERPFVLMNSRGSVEIGRLGS
jgi:hypothetical protein